MKRMVIKRSIAIAMITALSMNFCAPYVFAKETTGQATTQESKVVAPLTTEQKMKQFMTQYGQALGLTSIQYALMDQGKVVVSGQEGVYSKSENVALTNEHMYGIGSTSKTYTAAAVMKLVDLGKVDLDQPVINYIPEFKMADERYKKITVRMLLDHSSGLMGSTFQNSFLLGDNSTYAHDHFLKAIENQTLKADPGAYSVYCNDGFTLAELVVEKVSGMSFTAFLDQYITGPIGATNTKTPQSSFDRKQLVQTYLGGVAEEVPDETVGVIGAGGIYSTAEDLCRFGNLFTTGGNSVLSAKSVEEMMKPSYVKESWLSRDDANFEYGLGWDETGAAPFEQYGIKAVVKGGDTLMSHSSLVVLPEKNISIAVVSSGGASNVNQMLATMIAQDYLKLAPAKSMLPTTPLVQQPMGKEMLEYSGAYGSTFGVSKLTIKPEGTLSLGIPGMPDLMYVGNGTFGSANGGGKVSFEKKKDGRIYMVQETIMALPGYGESKSVLYMGEKLEAQKVDPAIWANWQKRVGKMYFVINETYTTQLYTAPMTILHIDETLPGYVGSNQVISATKAIPTVQCAQMGGRDQFAIEVSEKNGAEYLHMAGSIYVDGASLTPLTNQSPTSVKIGTDGYAQWHTLDKATADQTLTVVSKGKGAFMVYDQKGMVLFNSYVTGKNEVKLPAEGYVVFNGEVGTTFDITMK